VDVAGQTIAATTRRSPPCVAWAVPDQAGSEDAPETTAEAPEKLVPLILDNIESLDYAAPASRVPRSGNLPGVLSRVTLLEHQRDGLRWLQDHWVTGSRGPCSPTTWAWQDAAGAGLPGWLREQIATTGARRPILVVAPTAFSGTGKTSHNASRRAAHGPIVRAYGPELSALARTRASERIDRLSGAAG